jgi:hypothetical protein
MDASAFAVPRTTRPFDYGVAFNIARAVVAANSAKADATGLSPDELMSVLTEEIWSAHDGYDPAIAAYVTYAGGVAYRRMLNRIRGWQRHQARQRTVAELPEPSAGYGGGGGGGRSFFFANGCPEMLERIPRKLHPYRGGRLGHPPRGLACALAYREERGLSWWGLRAALLRDRALVLALGLSSVPAKSTLIQARHRLRSWNRRAGVAVGASMRLNRQ